MIKEVFREKIFPNCIMRCGRSFGNSSCCQPCRAEQLQKTSQEQYNILRIDSAFYYMRDVYLKGSPEERGENYAFLTTLAESLHSDDAQAQAVADLVMAVRNNVPPDSSHATELYEKIDNIEIFTDTRGDNCKISVDVDEIHKLIDEINQYQPE